MLITTNIETSAALYITKNFQPHDMACLIIVEMDIWHILLIVKHGSISITLTYHLHHIYEMYGLGYVQIDSILLDNLALLTLVDRLLLPCIIWLLGCA